MDRPLARFLARATLLTSLLTAPSLAQGGQPGSRISYEPLGKAFVQRHCGPRAELADCALEEILAREFVRLRAGSFDLEYPAAGLREAEAARDLQQIAVGLLDLQERLTGWLALEEEVAQGVTADLGRLREWIRGWKPAQLARLAGAEDKDLLVALEAPQEVAEACARLQQTLKSPRRMGLAPQYVDGVAVLCCPTRREFMETLGYLGLVDETWRDQHWVEGSDQWTQFWKGPRLVLALEYAPMKGADPDYGKSLDPEKLDKGGRMQHVLNQAARALLFRLFNRPELAHLERSLAANLVIETAGRIMVLDGEGVIRSSGGETAPYERFVPGGNPNGGWLPPISAAPLDHLVASRWREGKGSDWFVGVLRKGQLEGCKLARKDRANPKRKDKLAHFVLDGEGSDEPWLVSAPFLGELATEQAYPPSEYLNDYREFFKSYQISFYRWLRTEGVPGSPRESAAKFDEFLRILGKPGNKDTPEAALERVHGVPMSARDGSVDSLEWRFLAWLAERK